MNLCGSGHDEVAYEGRSCPVCDLIETNSREMAELDEQLKGVISERDSLESEVDELRGYLEEHKLLDTEK